MHILEVEPKVFRIHMATALELVPGFSAVRFCWSYSGNPLQCWLLTSTDGFKCKIACGIKTGCCGIKEICSGCASPSGQTAICFLIDRKWSQHASCPSVRPSIHLFSPVNLSPPPRKNSQEMLSLQWYEFVFSAFAQIDVPGTSGGVGSPGKVWIRCSKSPQGAAAVVLHTHSGSVPLNQGLGTVLIQRAMKSKYLEIDFSERCIMRFKTEFN